MHLIVIKYTDRQQESNNSETLTDSEYVDLPLRQKVRKAWRSARPAAASATRS